MRQIEEAAKPEDIPTVMGLRSNLGVARLPSRAAFGVGAAMPNEDVGDLTTPEFNQLLAGRREKQEQFRVAVPPTTRQHIGPTGVREEYEEQFDPFEGGYRQLPGARQMERTAEQEGTRKANESVTQQQQELDLGLPEMRGTAASRQEDIERPGKAQTAAATSAATTSTCRTP